MKGHHQRAAMMVTRDSIRHHAAVHDVNGIGIEPGDGAGNFALHPIVRQRALLPAIDKQNAHLQADGAQTLDLLLHKDAPARALRRRVHICYGQDSHNGSPGISQRGASMPASWCEGSSIPYAERGRCPFRLSLPPLSTRFSPLRRTWPLGCLICGWYSGTASFSKHLISS